jgi:hypothetical protein
LPQANRLLEEIERRFKECKLEVNQEKTRIVYCRRNQKKRPRFKVKFQKFDFLGHTFKPRVVKIRGIMKLGFTPAISQKSINRINEELFRINIHRMVQFPLSKIASLLQPKIRGWINYYGKFRLGGLKKLFRTLHSLNEMGTQ